MRQLVFEQKNANSLIPETKHCSVKLLALTDTQHECSITQHLPCVPRLDERAAILVPVPVPVPVRPVIAFATLAS